MKTLLKFWNEEDGQAAVEYILLLAVIVLVGGMILRLAFDVLRSKYFVATVDKFFPELNESNTIAYFYKFSIF